MNEKEMVYVEFPLIWRNASLAVDFLPYTVLFGVMFSGEKAFGWSELSIVLGCVQVTLSFYGRC